MGNLAEMIEPSLLGLDSDRDQAPVSYGTLPPMLTQYREYKSRYPDALLLFQVGDFYEVFFEDALTVSKTLNLTLTSRDKNSENPIPMCGVPISVVDGYVNRLVAAKFSVALVSQDPVPHGFKGTVPRRLERIVTPGITVMGQGDNATGEAIVAAVALTEGEDVSLAFTDPQSGEIFYRDGLSLTDLWSELTRIQPAEIICPGLIGNNRIDRRTGWVRQIEQRLRKSSIKFRSVPDSDFRDLDNIANYSGLSPLAKRAIRLLLGYVDEATVSSRLSFFVVKQAELDKVVAIDFTTRNALELVRTAREGSVAGSLFGLMNLTVTPGGAKKLRASILAPSTSLIEIQNRLQAVRTLKENVSTRNLVRELFGQINDFERLAARIELGIVTPRELGAVRDGAITLERVWAELNQLSKPPALIAKLSSALTVPVDLAQRLTKTLSENPPHSLNDGGVIKDGASAEVDRYRRLKGSGHSWIAEFEAGLRTDTGIGSLKVRYNEVLGYFIEVTKANLDKVPASFARRQSTTNSERFITDQLKSWESEILNAKNLELNLEREIFTELKSFSRPFARVLRDVGRAVSELDLYLCLAELAERENYVEPVINDSNSIVIKSGRHPVLANLIRTKFVANSLSANCGACLVITGPNMGGKSTYLRQSAIIVIMAQLGSFVPAEQATIGLVDKIFARIGAADDLNEGDSTFMVEMREAANIVQGATERSLILIDEIGRGTATLDGLSIAQALLEWLVVKIKARTLFATHFHELTELATLYPTVKNYSVASIESEEGVIFTHQIKPEPASKSYGLEVARLAGMPQELLERAGQIFRTQESKAGSVKGQGSQLSIFDLAQSAESKPKDYQSLTALKNEIIKLDLDNLTPLQALTQIDALKKQAKAIS